MANELRVAGGIASDCARCGVGGIAKQTASDWHCFCCGAVTAYRRCPRCKRTVIFGPTLTGTNVYYWKCPGCGKQAKKLRWPAAAISEFATPNQWIMALYGQSVGEALSDPGRRRIDGSILSLTGVSGIATGGSTVIFDRKYVSVLIGDTSNRFGLSYADIASLQVTGRGAFVTTSGGGWVGGGFGATGILEGVAFATVMNALTRRKHEHVETIFHLA